MDVICGKQAKEYILNKVTLLHIHRFNPSDVQFNDALVSSAVVWFKNCPPTTNHTVEFSYGGTLLKPAISKRISAVTLVGATKWSGFPNSYCEITKNSGKSLGDFFVIKRGIATGANDFFFLPKKKLKNCVFQNNFSNHC